jgi:hypothetical protein
LQRIKVLVDSPLYLFNVVFFYQMAIARQTRSDI